MTYKLLHVGCGAADINKLPAVFRGAAWQEIRVDIDPEVLPDIVGSMTDLSGLADESVDAIFSSHNIEHLYAHEVPVALAEWYRVLRPGGFLLMHLPDVQAVAREVAEGRLETALYESSVGPISAIDILWGLRSDLARGKHFMAHKTGFTRETLEAQLSRAGFDGISVQQGDWELRAGCNKPGAAPILQIHFDEPPPPPQPQGRWSFIFSLLRKR